MNVAKRIVELEDGELKELIDIWAERQSKDTASVLVERFGRANDKGQDVVGFLTNARHEGEWDVFRFEWKP